MYVRQVFDALFDQLKANFGREKGAVFFDHKEAEQIHLCHGVFHERAVPKRKGIAIHHNRADRFSIVRRQGGEDILRKALGAVRSVFQYGERTCLREQAEAAGRKEQGLLAARDYK